jgi:hypothetical protein
MKHGNHPIQRREEVIHKIKAAAMAAAAALRSPLLKTSDNTDDNGTEVMADIIEKEIKAALLPTVIDDAEVFDSEGTLSLMVNGYDVLYLSKCKLDDPNCPVLTDKQHQAIIDRIVAALGVEEQPRP